MSTTSNSSDNSCTLVRDQILQVGAECLNVQRTELTKSDFDTFTLIVEVASGNFVLANQLFERPDLLRGQQLDCSYDGTESKASLEILTKQEFGLGGQRLILHFVCSTIEAGGEPQGELFEFLIPHVQFGQGDYFTRHDYPHGGMVQTADQIKFVVDGIEWTLRTLIEIDGYFLPAPQAKDQQVASGAAQIHFNPSGHCALQVETSKIERQTAEITASNICWLLHLAFAQRVAWAELRIRSRSSTTFVCRRPFAFPTEASTIPLLRNWANGTIRKFLEGAYPVYTGDSRWWAVTLNWFSIAAENSALESSSMVYCMLFDRISSRLLDGFDFGKQISSDLADCLQDAGRRAELSNRLGQLLREYTDAWDDARSGALVNQIELWNNAPSYPKKIAAAFKVAGLKAPPSKLLQQRHQLMHEGGLKLRGQEAAEFLFDLHQHIVSLILTMLGYKGKFFSFGRGELRIRDFALEEPPDPGLSSSTDEKSKAIENP